MRKLHLAIALLATGCATSPPPLRYSLVGTWAFKDRITTAYPIDSVECGTDFGARYAADGTFTAYEEEGRWSVAGDVLTEIVEREPGEDGEMAAIAPKTRRGRLTWPSPRHVNVDFDGEVGGMIRCSE